MRTVKFCLLAGLTLSLLGLALPSSGEEKDKPKYTIKEVMKKAHAGKEDSLLAKVSGGTASKEEKQELAELYASLGKNKPPKGEQEAWDKKTAALIKASKDVLADKEGAGKELKKAANCGACHGAHKGK